MRFRHKRRGLFLAGMAWYAPSADAQAPEGAFLAANEAAMNKMLAGIAIKPTGRDFVAMMVSHHQGAIDMAQAELRYGSNHQLKTTAQEIIVDQMQEITLMRLAVEEPLPQDRSSPTQIPSGTPPAPVSQTSGAGQTQMQMSPDMHMNPRTNGNSN